MDQKTPKIYRYFITFEWTKFRFGDFYKHLEHCQLDRTEPICEIKDILDSESCICKKFGICGLSSIKILNWRRFEDAE